MKNLIVKEQRMRERRRKEGGREGDFWKLGLAMVSRKSLLQQNPEGFSRVLFKTLLYFGPQKPQNIGYDQM